MTKLIELLANFNSDYRRLKPMKLIRHNEMFDQIFDSACYQ